jgi:hypothetical protein
VFASAYNLAPASPPVELLAPNFGTERHVFAYHERAY